MKDKDIKLKTHHEKAIKRVTVCYQRTGKVCDITKEPYGQKYHGQAIGALGSVVGDKLRKLSYD